MHDGNPSENNAWANMDHGNMYCTSNAMEKSNHKHQYEHFWNDEDTYGGVDANRWTRFRQVAYEV